MFWTSRPLYRRGEPPAADCSRAARHRPCGREHDHKDNEDLAPENLGRGHAVSKKFQLPHLMGDDRHAASPKIR
jgi:hypothetical protein